MKATYKSGKSGVFQKSAGEGFGSQNSDFIRIGSVKGDAIEKLEVTWPSGKSSVVDSPDMSSVVKTTEGE